MHWQGQAVASFEKIQAHSTGKVCSQSESQKQIDFEKEEGKLQREFRVQHVKIKKQLCKTRSMAIHGAR